LPARGDAHRLGKTGREKSRIDDAMTLELSHPDSRDDCPATKTSQILTNADVVSGVLNTVSEYDDICDFGFDAGQ
jgi:hypothetical protein